MAFRSFEVDVKPTHTVQPRLLMVVSLNDWPCLLFSKSMEVASDKTCTDTAKWAWCCSVRGFTVRKRHSCVSTGETWPRHLSCSIYGIRCMIHCTGIYTEVSKSRKRILTKTHSLIIYEIMYRDRCIGKAPNTIFQYIDIVNLSQCIGTDTQLALSFTGPTWLYL